MQEGPESERLEELEPALALLRELWALDHALGSTSKRMHDRIGVTAQQRMVLRFLGKFPQITSVELARLLHVEKSTLSLALKRLEERGLVKRARDATDGRRAPIALTAQGRRFIRPAEGTVEVAVRRTLAGTRPSELRAVYAFLRRLVGALESSNTGHATRRRR